MPESDNNSTTQFPRLAVLEHLQEYSHASDEANADLKACMWQLTKSRRNVRGVMMRGTSDFKANSLREDWRARHRLVNVTEESELVDEDTSTKKSHNKSTTPQWKLQDVLAEKENTRKIVTPSEAKKDEDPTTSTGLRQRKTETSNNTNTDKSTDSEDVTSWTIVKEEDVDDEETMLLKKDPIEFFGGALGAPRDLRIAQQRAKTAMEGYIQAANEAAALLTILNEQQQQRKDKK